MSLGKTLAMIQGTSPATDPDVITAATEGWLDDHPEATTTVQDGSITKAKLDSDLQDTVDDVSSLKSAFNSLFIEDKSANLFNKEDVTDGKYFNLNGSGGYVGIASDSGTSISYVKIDGAGSYSAFVAPDFMGEYKAARIPLFDSSKSNTTVVTGTLDSGDNKICHFTISESDITNGAYYLGLTVRKNKKSTAMVVKSATYPTAYIPYYNYGQDIFTGKAYRENIMGLLVDESKSANLFNNNDVTYGQYFNINGTGTYSGVSSQGNAFIAYVPIDGAGNYSFKNASEIYGNYIVRYIAIFDNSKEYIKTVEGSIDNSDGTITHCEITDSDITDGAKYFGYTIHCTELGTAMFVKSNTYPASFVPYSEGFTSLKNDIKIPAGMMLDHTANPLFNKVVVFDGDSICQDGQVGGYAKIIGNGNGMIWTNEGIAGGTITAGLYSGSTALHWVSTNIDDIHSRFDSVDYLIFEGGTNDADRLTDEQIGTIDYSNFSTFDNETFVGALESLFYKALNYYPTAKIGFIVAQKMGYGASARYDAADSPSTRRRRKFFDTAIEVCEKWGIPYIDLWNGCPLNPRIESYYDSTMTGAENTEAGKAYTDGQHLTPVGYAIIAPKIEAWMKTL